MTNLLLKTKLQVFILLLNFSENIFVQEVSQLDFFPIYNKNWNTNVKFNLFYDEMISVCKRLESYKELSKKEVKLSSEQAMR